VLFATKSFPHPEMLALAGELLDGFDVASPAELALVSRDKIVAAADPTGATGPAGARAIVACETEDQVRAAPPNAEIALRISRRSPGAIPRSRDPRRQRPPPLAVRPRRPRGDREARARRGGRRSVFTSTTGLS